MEKITYRDLIKDDYEEVKKLICEAFGFNDFIKDKKTLDYLLSIYLQSCIIDSTFSKVAVKNSTVIGIILGNAKKDKNKIRKPHNIFSIVCYVAKLLFSSKENKEPMKEFTKIQNTYKELIKERKKDFQGCLQLFIVSKDCRGLGIGKSLVSTLFKYMQTFNVASLYLYTDTRCNYGFYDSHNFKRINEKELHFESFDETLNVFLYSYTF